MNRTLLSVAAIGLVVTSIVSCSDKATTGPDGIVSANASADAYRYVSSVSVSVLPTAVTPGDSATATAVLRDYFGRIVTGSVTWTTSASSVATVSPAGVVHSVAAGTASIKATLGSKTGSATLTVTTRGESAAVATVTVSLASSTITPGQTTQAAAAIRDASDNVLTGRVVTWSSGNTAVSTVSATGLVTAVGAGRATITALSETKTGASTITVSATGPAPVASVLVTPATASLQVGSTLQLSGSLRDANNNILTGRVITLSSSNTAVSTVSASGLVTAVGGGSAQVTVLSETKTGTSTITVSATGPAPVASLSVSPATANLQVGSTLQLSGTLRDANNNILTGRVITVSSSNTAVSTVSPSGLVTAVGAGNATITAVSETKAGTSAITVAAGPLPPPPPPPGSGPVWRGNEPSGMTSIKERSFNSFTEDASWSTLATPGASIGSDASAPHSPSSTLQINYLAGFAGGASPANSETYVGTYRVFYFCYWIKHSSNWQGHNTGISKHGYVWMGNNPLFVYEADGAGSNPLHARMALQGVVAQPNSDGWYTQNLVPSATFTRGQWDYVEILLTGNTSGTVDGAMDVYLNGIHVTHWAGIQYSAGTTQWNLFRIYPVWGGIGDVVTANQYLAWDHVYMSGRN